MKIVTTWIVGIIFCAAIYSLALASADPIDFATGFLIGAGVAWLVGPFMRSTQTNPETVIAPPFARRAIWFIPFIAAVLQSVVLGTFDVARYSLGLRKAEYEGIVAIPIGERTRSGVAVSAWATTLSPGTALVDVDWNADQILIHVIDARDPEAIRRDLQRFYDRFQRHVFP